MTVGVRLDPRHGLVRGVRAAVLAVPAVAVSAVAHHAVDRCLDVPGLLLATGTCWSGAVAVLGARRRLPALLVWLAAAQVVTHLLLDATCGVAGPAVPGPTGLAAHLVAVTGLALLLHRADADLWLAHEVVRAMLRLLPPRPPVHVPGRRPLPLPATATGPRPRTLLLTSPAVRRGPPSSACA